jgi:predicted transposase YbfD/YdcC
MASPAPPDLVLNRHCAECEFQVNCRKIAVEKDDLSLLAGMSAKERQKLRSKDIFIVTQLSYTFRSGRTPKRAKNPAKPRDLALQALAIRDNTVYIQRTVERRYYLTSLALGVETFARAVRGHWSVENKLHWVLDVCFREDQSRARAGSAAENLATLRRLALNLLRREKTKKRGIKGKQLNARWDQPARCAYSASPFRCVCPATMADMVDSLNKKG